MDETTLRQCVDRHLASLSRRDIEALEQDFVEPLRPHVRGIVETLPDPILTAENLSIEHAKEGWVVINRLVGQDVTTTMRSEWVDSDGRPRILSGAPVEP